MRGIEGWRVGDAGRVVCVSMRIDRFVSWASPVGGVSIHAK